MFKREHEEFIMIDVNFNIVKNDDKEYLYKEDDLYLEPNNVGYYSIIWMNYIYNYCVFHLRFKATNNFFFKVIFKLIKRIYTFEEIEHWICTIKTAIYRTFTLSFEYSLIYIKEEAMLERYQKSCYLEHYFEKAKE